MNSKEYFFNEVIKETCGGQGKPVRILELGCGTAKYVPAMVATYPMLEYVGIEPIKESYETALTILKGVPRTKVTSQLGYDSIEGLEDASFDIVISFSVLEHVKQLEKFIALAARYLKKDGRMVHRYDLGHALYPGTLKDKVHVEIGNIMPSILPERKFVRYVPMDEVVGYYRKFGVEPDRYTYHQMPNHKMLEKVLKTKSTNNGVMEEVFAWEFAHAPEFASIALPIREKLFPTVAVWGRKQGS